MADQTSTYAIQMVDEVSGAAETASTALAKLDQQLEADTKRLAGMQKAMRNLQGATTPNIAALEKMKTAIAAQKSKIAETTAAQLALGGGIAKMPKPKVDKRGDQIKELQAEIKGLTSSLSTAQVALAKTEGTLGTLQEKHEALKSKTADTNEQLKSLASSASQMPGPLGNVGSALSKVLGLIKGNPIAAGIMAIVAAVSALTVGTAKAIKSLYDYGTAQADARRSELLRLEGLTKMRFYFQRAPGNAKEMQDAIDQVSASTPLAREQVAKYSDQLYHMGLRGKALTTTLEAVAIKSSVQGEEAANAFAGWAAGANLAGQSVDKLAGNVKARLGGIAQKQMQSLTVQTLKQKEAQDALFSGLNIDAWLAAWKGVRDLMSQATATGRALKLMLSTLLQPLIGASTSGAPILKRFFQGLVIAALQLFILVLKARRWFRETFGDTKLFAGVDWLKAAMFAGRLALILVGSALGIVAGALYAVLRPVIMVVTAVGWLFQKFEELSDLLSGESDDWVGFATSVFDGIFDAIMSLPLFKLGKWIIDGIISGLDLGPFVDKMKGLAVGGLQAFAKAIGAESPAKAFIRVGKTIPEGVAVGVDEGAPDAQAAAAAMVDASAPALGDGSSSLAGGRGAPAAAARSGATINIGTINVNGSDAKQMAVDFRRELERVLEGFAFELGAREAGP